MQGRVRNAGFTGELLESQITPSFAEELSQLLCQSISHALNVAADAVPQVGYFALQFILRSVKMIREIHQSSLMETERVKMKAIAKCLYLAVLTCFAFSGCDKPKVTGLQCSVNEGAIFSDDVHYVNSSGKDLTEVHVTMTLTGENGDSRQFQRNCPAWGLGTTQDFHIPAGASVVRIQRVELSGNCAQGSISEVWIKH